MMWFFADLYGYAFQYLIGRVQRDWLAATAYSLLEFQYLIGRVQR